MGWVFMMLLSWAIFFGSLCVAQIGLPKFDLRLLQYMRVKEEVQKRKVKYRRDDNGHPILSLLGLPFASQVHCQSNEDAAFIWRKLFVMEVTQAKRSTS
ncbi:inositol 3-kinase-like [Gossypium australe]|uniref:Inositol 3-kinase-like n=1 Tax=Gossypium australe TaxID=47621 RepID=A0A5B6X9V2_9ROSI|nr:inositol 3-kinase-like [Gossypium australe]